MYVRQLRLQWGNIHTTVWVEADPAIKLGSVITFIDKEGEWKVMSVGRIKLEDAPRSTWRVGGMV